MDDIPRLGQLVYSRAGRDRGRSMVIVGLDGQRYVWVADGEVRRVTKPKRKNTRHLLPGSAVHAGVASGEMPTDASLRQWLRQVAEGGDRPNEGSQDGGRADQYPPASRE